jgi:hypothetical protein
MFGNEYPVFTKKKLLKIKMLEQLRDFPKNFADITYKDYSDGILSGFELKVEGDKLMVMPGIVINAGSFYLMNEAVKLEYNATNSINYVKIRFFDVYKDEECIKYLSDLVIEGKEADEKTELELGRFRLQKGARLRTEYIDFDDFDTQYDTVNRINVNFAGVNESTLWREIVQYYAREIIKCKDADMYDIGFGMGVLRDSGIVSREFIEMYLDMRTGKSVKGFDNKELYHELAMLLRKTRGMAGNKEIGNVTDDVMIVW